MDTPNREMGTNQRLVLNIDDNLANVMLIEQLLARRSDLKVITAWNGQQGIQLACELMPDVILLDTNLPDVDGLEVLKTIRGTPQTAYIPVIALSSNAFTDYIEEGMLAGYSAYVTKPFKIAKVLECIDDALLMAAVP